MKIRQNTDILDEDEQAADQEGEVEQETLDLMAGAGESVQLEEGYGVEYHPVISQKLSAETGTPSRSTVWRRK
ncbi:hypothetical protein C7212DRAFT_325516 [Tuber magnatum]|uniref:Uncharacterized protein n=1 Tax=Tuber magnatum TaxID=42249 RepID=A0A317SMI7_9PEZI|nr:hypothetical protein C7212DRAFT_325516 [Tuber magnatum]